MSLFSSRSTLAAALSLALCVPMVVHAQVVYDFDLPSQSLADSLRAVGSKAGVNVAFQPAAVQGKQAPALKGAYPVQEAIERLLQGSGLALRTTHGGSFLVEVPDRQANAEAASTTIANVQAPDAAIAQSQSGQSADSTQSGITGDNAEKKSKGDATTLDEIVVTGTRIRGGSTASPMISMDAQQIKQEGFTDLGEVIRSIPQNFSGGQNPGVASGASLGSIANQNATGSSALNLRGLGPDATLSLLNGRRLTYEGFVQAVDLSAIPVETVERIEIIPDGASAIYGSDAVAGVANVILKRDFDGVTVGARYGRATSGGLGTHEYTATAGTTWSTGGLIAAYKKASQDPISAEQRNYTRAMDDPSTIYAGSDLRSGLVSAYQLFGDVARLQVDALHTDRDQSLFTAYPGFYYRSDSQTSVSQVSPTVEIFLPADWTLTAGGTYGKDENIYKSYYGVGSSSDLQSTGCYCNKSHSYEVGAEGPLLALGGGDVRLAIGAGSRTDDFLLHSFISDSRQGGKEQSRFGYAELSVPVIGPASGTKGIHRLEFSAAVRSEDYDSFGRVTTPKLGLIYGPSANFTFKATWGKSFKAPTLLQRYSDKIAYLWIANQLGGPAYPADATVLMSYGGNADLNPERARTWTASLAFHPEALPGLEAELTWFDIDYTERVVQPIINMSQSLSDPNYAQFIQYSPTIEQQAALLAVYNGMLYNYAGADYDPSKVVALASDQYTNAARQRIKGVDLSGSYRFDLGGGRLILRGSATWLDSSQQNSAGQTTFDLSGTIFNPAKIKSRLGAVWTLDGFNVSGFVNYIGGVTNRLTTSTEKTTSFTTFDATLSYSTGERGDALSGLEFALSVDNLLNRDPPLYTTLSPSNVPYDSTNYSAIGRYLSLSVSKHW